MKSRPSVSRDDLVATARLCQIASSPNPSRKLSSRLVAILAPLLILPSGAVTLTWQGGNATWTDAANPTQWSPSDEPDSDDDAVLGTLNHNVILGSNNSILSLTMSNGISLATAGFDLSINGLLFLNEPGTDLTIDGAGSTVSADGVFLGNSAQIILDGGKLSMSEESGTGLIDINPGTTLTGTGTVSLVDAGLAAATTLMTHDGTISASAGLFVGTPPEGTLAIVATDANARINLDGAGNTAVVNVFRRQTLDLNVAQLDPFSASLNLFQQSVFDSAIAWSIDSGAAITVDNGAIPHPIIPAQSVPSGTGFIRGAAFTQSGGTITVTDTDGALQFDAPFTMSAGNLVNNGEVIFNAASTIGAGANFTMPSASSSLTVNAGVAVNVDQADFNADGGGFTTNVITIGSGGILDLNLGAGADEAITGTLNLNGGELDVTTTDGNWSIDGSVNVGASSGTSQINGEEVTFTSVPVTVGASSILEVNAGSTWTTGASLAVESGAMVRLESPLFNAPGTISGAGTLRVNSMSVIAGNTTFATDFVDLDGTDAASTCVIREGITLTINTTSFDNDGYNDSIDLAGNGASLSVNGPEQWILRGSLRANTTAAGLATIGGTSRMVLNGPDSVSSAAFLDVQGNTTISAPVTFGESSIASVHPGAVLTVNGSAIYDGTTIDHAAALGGGTFLPPAGDNNTVAANAAFSSIQTDLFAFDRGNWVLNGGLSVQADDYDSSPTNQFDAVITVNDCTLHVDSLDPGFVMDGVMNLVGTDPFSATASYSGDPITIGNDLGVLDADFNVTGNCRIRAEIDFKSDADVNIQAGGTLYLPDPVRFNTSNGANHAEFTGGGNLYFESSVHFNEPTTLDLAGGAIRLDGLDFVGDTIHVDAPVVFNADTLFSFGRANTSGVNIIEVDNLAGSGTLTVNLDDPADEWTLNSPGRINLINDGTVATLLAGSAINLNGTVNVTGDVRTDARVDIGATAVINLQTSNEPFRLSGGSTTAAPNTIAGATVTGPGRLGADSGSALTGFGTIAASANIDFDFDSDLLADNGTLTVNSSILDVRNIGTAASDGILNVINAWTPPTGSTVLMQGGSLKGGTITLNNADGIIGRGTVSAKIINNTRIAATSPGQTLVVQTAANDNDWDGGANSGDLEATGTGAVLEIRDNATENFLGTVSASGGGTVFTSGFELVMQPGSSLDLSGGRFRTTNGAFTHLLGTVAIGPGDSTLLMTPGPDGGGFSFGSTSSTTLTGNLRIESSLVTVDADALFGGGGQLITVNGGILAPDHGATLNVTVENRGTYSPGNVTHAEQNDLLAYAQTSTGNLKLNLDKPGFTGSHDRIFVSGAAVLDGTLTLVDGKGLQVGEIVTVLTASSVTGTFATIVQPPGLPANRVYGPVYNADSFQLIVVDTSPYGLWIDSFASLTSPADKTKTANPDGDGLDNLGEFALDGNPASGVSSGKVVGKIASVGGLDAMTFTIPVRAGAVPDPGDPAGGELVLKQAADGLTYRIQASDGLASFGLDVTEVTGPDAAAIQAGLPPLNAGWNYRTFRSPGPLAGDPGEFLRVSISG